MHRCGTATIRAEHGRTGFVDGLATLAMLSDRFCVDIGQYALGGSVPSLALLDTYHSFARITLDNTWREATTST